MENLDNHFQQTLVLAELYHAFDNRLEINKLCWTSDVTW